MSTGRKRETWRETWREAPRRFRLPPPPPPPSSVDDEAGPNLYKIDPAGHFLGYKACSAGIKEQEAANLLEKAYKKAADDNTVIDPIRIAISTFQSLLSADFKAEEIEVGLAAKGARFRVLTTAEVEAHLVALAEAQ